MKYIKRLPLNDKGRDIAVGDIHGHFTKLSGELKRIGFNPELDRLISCGDLVDRGPESHHAASWLQNSWFHSVRGNHDDYVVRHKTVDTKNWIRNGGLWFQSLLDWEKTTFIDAFSCLPLMLEVETERGLVGIVHADPTVTDWRDMPAQMESRNSRNRLMWSRRRVDERDDSIIDGVRAVVCGHEPVNEPLILGNVYHIDTMGWLKEGKFTLLNLATLEPL